MKRAPKLTEKRFDEYAESLRRFIAESVSPFKDDTPKKKDARKKRAKQDLQFFCSTYLPHYFSVPFAEFHDEWGDLFEMRDDVVLIAAPREHAKSTFATFGKPLQNIVCRLRHFQLIISDTNDQATGFTMAIRAELEENPRIKQDFGDLRETPWSRGDFVWGGVRTLARGSGEKVRGLKHRQHRPDYAAVDDFENDENVRNPNQVKKGLDWLRKAVIGSLGKGYTFVMVGNLFSPKSVLSQLIAETDENDVPVYVSRIYRAWIDYGKPTQRPLWPDLWPRERLEDKRRTMRPGPFDAEMMNLVREEGSPFPEEWFRYYGEEDIAGLELSTLTGVDPSMKSGQNNDFQAVVTVGWDRDAGMFYVLHASIRHQSPRGMLDTVWRHHEVYNGPARIEENFLFDFLREAIDGYIREFRRIIPWVPVHHGSEAAKEARIIGTLSHLVEYGKLRFRRGHSDQERLVEQLIHLLNATVNDDGPDALEMAVSGIDKICGDLVIETTGQKRDSMHMDAYAGGGMPGGAAAEMFDDYVGYI